MIFLFPETGGDYEIYFTVAKNIFRGCGVSLSSIESTNCVPHFGGNHGPGYPFFMAIIWHLFSESNNSVRICQTIAYSISALWLINAVYNNTKNMKIFIATGIIFSLSPLMISWPRYIQTETLSLAASIWVLAELLHSINAKKIRVL